MNRDSDHYPSLVGIEALLAFLPTFERPDFDPFKEPVAPNPFYVFVSDDLSQFEQAAYEHGFVFSFNWPEWQDKAKRFYEQPELLRTATMQDLRKLLTTHVRKERFCEGHLPEMVRTGHLAAILRRLSELKEAA